MTLAYTFALLSTLLGTALGLLGGHGRLAGGLRSFAFVAATTVVFGQLLPEALTEAGLVVLLVFAAGVGLPRWLFRHQHHEGGDHGHGHHQDDGCETDAEARIRTKAGLWLSLVAMMLHEVGDGVAIGTFASGAHAEHLHLEVFFAIAAHTVPVVALLVQAFVPVWGRTIAFFQGLALGLSGMLGVALAGAVSESAAVALTPYITAFAGGLLIHVVSHDHSAATERSPGARVVDVLAVIAGVVLVSQGGHAHGEYSGEAHGEVAESVSHIVLELSLELAPALLLGVLLTALVQSLRDPAMHPIVAGEGALRQALRGVLAGATLPTVTSAVVPAAHQLRSGGASVALVTGVLLAAPQVGLDSGLVHGRFLGWQLSLVRALAALLIAVGLAWLVGRLAQPPGTQAERPRDQDAIGGGSLWTRSVDQADALFVHLLPHMILGLLAAAYVDVAVEAGTLERFTRGSLDILVVTLVAIPLPLGVVSASPLAAVLVSKGLSSGAVLAALLVGPTLSLATIGYLRASFGPRAAVLATVSVVTVAWGLAYTVNAVGLESPVSSSVDHAHGWFAHGALVLLIAWGLRCVYQHGVSALVGGLGFSDRAHESGHAHGDHAHVHGGHGHGDHGHGGHGH